MNHQKGFTLVELVIVIVILGILAAVAIPRFVDFSGDAEEAAVKGVAGSMGSAMSINYASCQIDPSNTTRCRPVLACSDAGNLLLSLPDGYTVTGDIGNVVGETGECTVTKTGTSFNAKFIGIRTHLSE